MAKTIKGINVKIGSETTGLSNALKDVNKKSKDIQSELRKVERLLRFNPDDTELLAQKQKLLGDQVETTKEKFDRLKQAQKQVNDQFEKGDISEQQYRDFQRELVETESKLGNYERKLKDVNRANDDFARKMDKMSKKLKSVGDKMKNVGSTLSTKLTAPIVGGAVAAVEGTRELREDLSKLEVNAAQAGVGLDKAEKALRDLNAITGETDSNIEAISNLMAAGLGESELESTINSLSGAVIKFPDTLKIESLSDGLQETLATGQAVGPFAELLERMGVDLEAFNEGLDKANEKGEAQKYVLEQLNSLNLSKVNEEYRKNNKELIDNANAQNDLKMALADLGETLEPVITKATELVGNLVEKFNNMSPGGQKAVLAIAGIAAAIGPVLVVLGTLASSLGSIIGLLGVGGAAAGAGGTLAAAFAAITGPVGIAIAAIGGIIAVGVAVYKNWDVIKEKAKALWEFIKAKFQQIKESITKPFKAAKEFLEGFSLKDIGKNIMNGLTDGIKSKISNLKDTVTGIGSTIKDKISGVLQIRSPSRVMEKLGEYTGEGFAIGLENSMGQINNQALKIGTSKGRTVIENRHSGTLRVEGVNNQGEFIDAVKLVMDDMRRENRRGAF